MAMSGNRRALRMSLRVGAVACSAVVGLVVGSGSSGAAITTAFGPLGPPSGYSCSDTMLEAGLTIDTKLPGTGGSIIDNVPFDSWNGTPLLGLIEGPQSLKTLNGIPLAGNCGDTAHGSSATGLDASARTTYADGNGVFAMSSAVSSTAPLNALGGLPVGVGQSAFTQGSQSAAATLTPSLTSQSETVTASYTVDVLAIQPGPGSSAPYLYGQFQTSGPVSCQGSQTLPVVTRSGPQTDDWQPGVQTASETWTCPAGQPIQMGQVSFTMVEQQELLVSTGVGGGSRSQSESFADEGGSVTVGP